MVVFVLMRLLNKAEADLVPQAPSAHHHSGYSDSPPKAKMQNRVVTMPYGPMISSETHRQAVEVLNKLMAEEGWTVKCERVDWMPASSNGMWIFVLEREVPQ